MENISISMGKRQLVDSIWKSAGIEGLGTTFPDTQKILEGLPVTTTAEEVLFITNMKRTWYFVFENVERPNNLSFLREINKISMQGLSYDAGNIRNVPVSIGGTSWRPGFPQPGLIIEDLERINSIEDKVDSALEMFCYIARSQIFLDGNKRAAQLMCNKMMMQYDLGIFSVPYDRIDDFSGMLIDMYVSGDTSAIKDFFTKECLLLNYNNRIVTDRFGIPGGDDGPCMDR